MVSTLDFESSDPSSNLGGTSSIFFFPYLLSSLNQVKLHFINCTINYALINLLQKLILYRNRCYTFKRKPVSCIYYAKSYCITGISTFLIISFLIYAITCVINTCAKKENPLIAFLP
jgi:hypothetical protein